MKKISTLCLIACALTISTNSFAMLRQTARITRTKKSSLLHARSATRQKAENNKEYRYSAESIEKKLRETTAKNKILMQAISEQDNIVFQLNEFDYRWPFLIFCNAPKINKLMDQFDILEKQLRE